MIELRCWAIDENGYDTTDANAAILGTILPMGQHKGYGLSMFVDVLSAGLSMASMSFESESMFNSQRPANIGHFFQLIKIEDLIDKGEFQNRIENWVHLIRQSKKRPGFDEIFIPGEIENRKLRECKSTININDRTMHELEKLIEEMSI